jgi:hypothetical protein
VIIVFNVILELITMSKRKNYKRLFIRRTMPLGATAASVDSLFSKLMQIPLLISSIVVISLNGFVFDTSAQQGGAATGGDATTGGPNCNVAYACTITQAPRGGDATGGDATGSPPPAEESPPPAESPPNTGTTSPQTTTTPELVCLNNYHGPVYLQKSNTTYWCQPNELPKYIGKGGHMDCDSYDSCISASRKD